MSAIPTFLSVADTCQRLSISRSFFYLLAKRGDLTAVKLGRRTLVPISEIERLLPSDPSAALGEVERPLRAKSPMGSL